MQFNTLILDDEKLICSSMKRLLQNDENIVHTATKIETARTILDKYEIDLVLLDYALGDIDGITVLKEIKQNFPQTVVIMLTAYATIHLAVEAMKLGAFDFVEKDESSEITRYAVRRGLDHQRLRKEVEDLRLQCLEQTSAVEIISVSPEMREVLDLSKDFARTDATVLITGETGTGKNLLSRYIHFNSSRFDRNMVTLNCAAIPSELIESELFGYESGSFTGARKGGKQGLIEQAHKSTLVLDEISELSIDLQTKLLHVLESGEFYRIGGVQPIKNDVRFIACSNANLPEMIRERKFRSDLFYRLNVANIRIPSLRERRMDILPLAKHFINKLNVSFKKSVTLMDKEVENFIITSTWMGNVRELRNYIERGILLAKGGKLMLSNIRNNDPQAELLNTIMGEPTFSIKLNPQPDHNLLHEVQDQLVEQVLELTNQNRTSAARMLGIPRTSLNNYIKRADTVSHGEDD